MANQPSTADSKIRPTFCERPAEERCSPPQRNHARTVTVTVDRALRGRKSEGRCVCRSHLLSAWHHDKVAAIGLRPCNVGNRRPQKLWTRPDWRHDTKSEEMKLG